MKADVLLNLGSTAVQPVHLNRTLKLNSGSTFENAVGGSGHDTITGNSSANNLTGNSGNDILVGGLGNDTLSGGNDKDILIGGLGGDSLLGGNHEDILIAGRTTKDAFFSQLNELRTEWTSLESYTIRIANLRTGAGPTGASLKILVSVFDDMPHVDTLTGGAAWDWYFRALDDAITDLLVVERLEVF